jgi:formylglycine-generating enzyme required for sulfatase activity
MRRLGWVALALVLLMLATAPAALAEKRIALLIGNKDYKPGVGALVNPVNDVRIVGEALKAVGFEVLPPAQNVRRAQMLRALYEFAAKLKIAGPDAVGFLYYSGHGIASAGENYLIPVDVDEPSTVELSVQGVKQSEVLAILRTEAPNAAHYLVLDACRNTLQGARGGKGFLPVGQQSGVLVAFAAEPGKTASDTGQGSGPYAAALATELVKPGQSDLIMFHHVRVAVMEKTGGDQVPWTEDGIQRRERVLFGGEIKAAPAQPQVSEAERTWAWMKNTTDQAMLESFIKQFGNTPSGALARARIAELKRTEVAVAAPPKAPAQVLSKPLPQHCDGVEAQVGSETRCLRPKDTFKDCDACPEMVVVPAGEFMMGSEEDSHQKPVHKVTIARSFAVGKFELTVGEYLACVAALACRPPEWNEPGNKYNVSTSSSDVYKKLGQALNHPRHPIVGVSWDNAKQYVAWLSEQTGEKPYRLLTEAEWEYAARAGSRSKYTWGDEIGRNRANCDGCGSQWDLKQTAPVGSFQANAFGLHDMHGNVWEWVADCYKDNYANAPSDGKAMSDVAGCQHILRGGAWSGKPESLRSAKRTEIDSDYRGTSSGIRLARALNP